MKLPRKLALLPGLRWSGHMKVIMPLDDGRWLIDWDAEIVDVPRGTERWVGDRAVLTAAQIEEWTGVTVG